MLFTKRIIISLVVVFASLSSLAITKYSDSLFSAYLKSDMNQWKKIIDEMEADKLNKSDINFTSELLSYQYGYVAWKLGNKFEEEAEEYLDIAEENLEWLEENKYDSSTTLCYRSAFYGFRIGLNSWYVTLYGFKCSSSAEEAKRLNPNNPFAYVQLANIKYYQPEFMGGSKIKAVNLYLEAEAFYKKGIPNPQLKYNWLYINVLSMIAITHAELEDYEEAKKYYQKILSLQPNYGWIKDEMLPNLMVKMKG